MISFHVGEFGIVLTRKIIFGIFLSIVLIFTIYLKLDFSGHHHHGPVTPTYVTWDNFQQECGRVQILEQPGVYEKCKNKYHGKTVMDWRGNFI